MALKFFRGGVFFEFFGPWVFLKRAKKACGQEQQELQTKNISYLEASCTYVAWKWNILRDLYNLSRLLRTFIHLLSYLGLQDALNRLFNVGFEDVGLCEFLVPVCCQPDPGQRALLGQDKVGVEHGYWRPGAPSRLKSYDHSSLKGPGIDQELSSQKARFLNLLYVIIFQNTHFYDVIVVKQSRWPPN